MKKSLLPLSFALAVLLCGCPEKEDAAGDEISVSVAPAAYLAERVAGGEFRINTLLDAGKNPHDYELTPLQTSRLYRSKAYFSAGLPFEHHAEEAVRGKVPVLPLLSAVTPLPYTGGGHDHDHGAKDRDAAEHDHDHGHGAVDPHVWFSAVNAAKIAAFMAEKMAKIKPEKAAFFRKNAEELRREFFRLDTKLKAALRPFAGQTIYVYHPSFGYFARDVGMKQRAIELEGREIPLSELNRVIREAKQDQVRVILVQPNFSTASAEALAKGAGCRVAAADPLQYDLPAALSRLGEILANAGGKSGD